MANTWPRSNRQKEIRRPPVARTKPAKSGVSPETVAQRTRAAYQRGLKDGARLTRSGEAPDNTEQENEAMSSEDYERGVQDERKRMNALLLSNQARTGRQIHAAAARQAQQAESPPARPAATDGDLTLDQIKEMDAESLSHRTAEVLDVLAREGGRR